MMKSWTMTNLRLSVTNIVIYIYICHWKPHYSYSYNPSSNRIILWTMFTAQVPKFFVPGPDLCIDEQLVACRGRCNFRKYVYRPNLQNTVSRYGGAAMLLFHIHRLRIYIWADMRELSVRQDKVHETTVTGTWWQITFFIVWSCRAATCRSND